VTLLLGPVACEQLDRKVKLKRFSFFKELDILLKKELRLDYDIVIQAAAISDFAPKFTGQKKISSHQKELKLTLKPTVKLINCLRMFKPRAFLVGFKFEPHIETKHLIEKTRKLIKSANLDLAVGNHLKNKRYNAYLINRKKIAGPFLSKSAMTNSLIRLIRRAYVRK